LIHRQGCPLLRRADTILYVGEPFSITGWPTG
jgi:hypothetical protein